MTIPVAQEPVHQSCREEGPRIDEIVGAVLHFLVELIAADDLERAREGVLRVVVSFGTLLEGAQHSTEVSLELAETRIAFGENDEARLGVQYAGAREERCDDEWRHRIGGADLILHDPGDHRAPELGWKNRRRVLVDGAEGVFMTIRALEPQRLRLLDHLPASSP